MRISNRLMIAGLAAGLIGGALTGGWAAQLTANERSGGLAPEPSGTAASAGIVPGLGSAATTDHLTHGDPAALFSGSFDALKKGEIDSALEMLEAAASHGHLRAQWKLARMFLDGSGVTRDDRLGLHYLLQVVAQHDPERRYGPHTAMTVEALVDLGRIYRDGAPDAGVPVMPERAALLFTHAAQLYRHPRAQYYLALLHLEGRGVRADESRALRWLSLAANKRYAPAQADLGRLLLERGGEGDHRLKGLMWLALAAQNAKSDDARALFEDRYTMAMHEVGEEDRAVVDTLIHNWNAGHVVTTAFAE